jgi:hypothetical protein
LSVVVIRFVCMHVYMYACIYLCTHVYMYACIYLCTHVSMYVCMYVCMYACMYVCMCVCECMYVCIYVCVYICMCVYTRLFCTYIQSHKSINKDVGATFHHITIGTSCAVHISIFTCMRIYIYVHQSRDLLCCTCKHNHVHENIYLRASE